MKKILLVTILAGATAVGFSQGTLLWNNTANTLITLDGVSLPANNPQSLETTYNFGLFIAPSGTAAPTGIDDANWQFVAAYAVNSTAASGAGRLQNPGTTTVAGYAAGTEISFIVRGWQSSTGTDNWEAAKPGLSVFGTSTVGTLVLGGGAIPNSSAWGLAAGTQIQGLNLVSIPEPTSMALAGLGAAALLIFRRRK